MTSKIKVDNINKVSDDSNIIKKCGSTITLGASGDSIALASGASQTGFGRTGTVDWQTGSIKTATFTAANGEGYFCNTTGGSFEVDLPAGSAGAIVSIQDYANTFDTNNVTLARNGSNIGGSAVDATLSTEGLAVTLVYVDATKGWLVTDDGLQSQAPTAQFVTATGGTITTSGNFKIHTFTGPGTFTVSCAGNPAGSASVDYLVVAGGGGGGTIRGGGGGAGGYRESSGTASGCYTASPLGACVSALPVVAQGYPITVGGGGAGNPSPGNSPTGRGSNGDNSVFSTITSTGGGNGGNNSPPSNINGKAGG